MTDTERKEGERGKLKVLSNAVHTLSKDLGYKQAVSVCYRSVISGTNRFNSTQLTLRCMCVCVCVCVCVCQKPEPQDVKSQDREETETFQKTSRDRDVQDREYIRVRSCHSRQDNGSDALSFSSSESTPPAAGNISTHALTSLPP